MSVEDKSNEKSEEYAIDSPMSQGEVLDAVRRSDWECLRTLSLRAGGFGDERRYVWPFLVHAELDSSCTASEGKSDTEKFQELRRRRGSPPLGDVETSEDDTGRDDLPSANTEAHPDERQIKLDTDRSFVLYSVEGQNDREALQTELNELITTVFRRHPQLSYFQGYHDIITVLFLTLPKREQLLCAEKISLHRVRDAMGKGLEPLLGLLQIMKYLFRLADPEFSSLLERNTPLPYFALSNLLTLFSHDVPTLPLIQHVFDFILCRPPVIVVYLAAAITLARRDEAFRMEREGEEGMLHSLLTSLPELSDGEPDEIPQPEDEKIGFLPDDILKPASSKSNLNTKPVQDMQGMPEVVDIDKPISEEKTDLPVVERKDRENKEGNTGTRSGGETQPSEPEGAEESESFQHAKAESETSLQTDGSQSATLPGSSIVSDLSSEDLNSSDSSEAESSLRSAPPQSRTPPEQPPPLQIVSLSALLKQADTLYRRYPPSHPSLHVSSIMGPQSVIFTWSEDPHQLASDADAEAIVTHPELVILPFVDPDEVPETKETSDGITPRRKLRKRRRHFGVRLDKKTVLTGTVVALSVAVAVYSMRAKGQGGVLDVSRTERTLRKTARVVSGVLIGGSEKLLETFGW